MRIKATCSKCRRDLLLSQLVEGPEISDRCPWCGTLLAPQHTLLLTDTVRRAERAGAELERALERLGGGWAGLHIRPESVLDPIRARLLGGQAAQGTNPCVSLFLPTHRGGREVQQAPIRLKNLLRQAADGLEANGASAPTIESLLAPLRRLLDDRRFWLYQSDGLALFSRPGWWGSFRVPLDLPELAVVADRFHVTPLLPLLTGGGHFFVLALSQNQIRLLEGTRDRLEEVDLPGEPLGGRDALQGEVERQVQLYVADRGGVGARGIFHGHGDMGDVQEERVLQYFRSVDQRLREVLAGEHAPMVLAAVEHLAPLWRRATTYPHLVDQTLPGNPEELRPDQLHARAWPIVEPLFLQVQRQAAARYDQLAGTGLTSQDPQQIAGAAEEGRVETLFVSQYPAGSVAVNATGEAAPHRDASGAARELVGSATATTLSKGGTVYALPSGEVPGGGRAAAVFRY